MPSVTALARALAADDNDAPPEVMVTVTVHGADAHEITTVTVLPVLVAVLAIVAATASAAVNGWA